MNKQIKAKAAKLVKQVLETKSGKIKEMASSRSNKVAAVDHYSEEEVKADLAANVEKIVDYANKRGYVTTSDSAIAAIENAGCQEMIDPDVAADLQADDYNVPFTGVIDCFVELESKHGSTGTIQASVITPKEAEDFKEMLLNDGIDLTIIPIGDNKVMTLHEL